MTDYPEWPPRIATPSDIAIILPNERHKTRLRLKLEEYRIRNGERDPPLRGLDDTAITALGHEAVRGMFNHQLMKILVDLALQQGRDTLMDPITMPEIATGLYLDTGMDMSDAMEGPLAVPFVYDREVNWYLPDFTHRPSGGSLGAIFAESYGVIRAYGCDRKDMVRGGSWLVEVPWLPAQAASDTFWDEPR